MLDIEHIYVVGWSVWVEWTKPRCISIKHRLRAKWVCYGRDNLYYDGLSYIGKDE